MSGRALTIELSDEEYRRLAAIAERRGVDVGELAREGIRTVLGDVDTESKVDQLKEAMALMAKAREGVKPWKPGEFEEFLAEAKRERDDRPPWP